MRSIGGVTKKSQNMCTYKCLTEKRVDSMLYKNNRLRDKIKQKRQSLSLSQKLVTNYIPYFHFLLFLQILPTSLLSLFQVRRRRNKRIFIIALSSLTSQQLWTFLKIRRNGTADHGTRQYLLWVLCILTGKQVLHTSLYSPCT